jgi:prepilin-type N-terminal cleavage/methylation domain-containing protein
MNNKGFSLIELLVVLAIISILAIIGIPTYIGQQKNAARTEAYTNLGILRLLEEQYYAEKGEYTPSIGNAGPDKPGSNVELIQAALPGFKPQKDGLNYNLNFSYAIRQNASIASQTANSTATPCFLVIASGNAKSRVAGDSFMIDCTNQRNF